MMFCVLLGRGKFLAKQVRHSKKVFLPCDFVGYFRYEIPRLTSAWIVISSSYRKNYEHVLCAATAV